MTATAGVPAPEFAAELARFAERHPGARLRIDHARERWTVVDAGDALLLDGARSEGEGAAEALLRAMRDEADAIAPRIVYSHDPDTFGSWHDDWQSAVEQAVDGEPLCARAFVHVGEAVLRRWSEVDARSLLDDAECQMQDMVGSEADLDSTGLQVELEAALERAGDTGWFTVERERLVELVWCDGWWALPEGEL